MPSAFLSIQGGTVCVAQENERLADLAGCITRLQVNWLYLTSSVASMLRPDDVPGLETLVVGGEAVHQQIVETWAESKVTLINAYGPAETTIYCSARTVPTKGTDARDIGTALGCRMWIGWAPEPDDENCSLRLAPLGATGELLIEGPILAREYLGRPELNATKFVGMPWLSPDRKVYRTGDLACQDAQGHFHFRGRRGNGLVKINGQRLDVGEVTAVLASSRGDIQQAAAVAFERQGGAASSPRHPATRLAAFLVFADTASALGAAAAHAPLAMTDALRERMLDVKKHLQRLLPQHMVPSVFVPMSALPKTGTLKTDLKALTTTMETLTETDLQSLALSQTADAPGSAAAYKAPRNAMESALLQRWTTALGLSASASGTAARAGVDDNFFDLGGDSISAMHFIWLARGDGLHLSVADVNAHPSVSELAVFLAARRDPGHDADDIPLPFSLVSSGEKDAVLGEMRELGFGAAEIEDIYVATATQRGLLLESETSQDMWVSKDVFEFEADVDPERLRVAWERLVELNPIFRTRIVHAAAVGGVAQAYQVVLRPGKVWDDGSQKCVFGFGHPLSVHRIQRNQFQWIRHHSLCKYHPLAAAALWEDWRRTDTAHSLSRR